MRCRHVGYNMKSRVVHSSAMNMRNEIELEQNRLIGLHPLAEQQLLQYPNVHCVGVGVKETDGRLTEDLCFRVYVHKKLKRNALKKADRLPRSIMGVKVDVLERHPVVLNALPDRTEYDSLRGGVQIRNEFFEGDNGIGAGTIGCLARTNDADNKLVGLSTQHVLTDGLTGNPLPAVSTVEIGHPRWIKCCCCCSYNEVGDVMRVSSVATLDCGIFVLDSSACSDVASSGTENLIQEIGTIAGVAQAVCYEVVRKRGVTTGLTQGVVVDVMFDGTNILINPCAEFPNFTQPGDSGAVIVNSANKVIGLLIGSSRTDATKGVAHHIKPVLSELNIKIAGEGASTSGLVGVPAANCAPGGVTTCSGGVAVSMAASSAYFRELDDGTLFLTQQPAYSSEGVGGPLHVRRNDIFGLVVPKLQRIVFNDSDSWEQRAKLDQLPAVPTVTMVSDPDLRAAIERLSVYQLDLLRLHFPGTTPQSIDADKTRITFERFMNGELRERPSGVHPYGQNDVDGAREPNGSFEMLFSGFAWLCIENGIDAAAWTPLYNLMVQCQELFMCVYRRRPQTAPPAGSVAFNITDPDHPLVPLTNTIGDAGFGDEGFSFAHFNLDGVNNVLSVTSIGQSNEARKIFLRNKYAAFDYAQTKVAMKENIQRMLYMP
jgi:hypothetical protein